MKKIFVPLILLSLAALLLTGCTVVSCDCPGELICECPPAPECDCENKENGGSVGNDNLYIPGVGDNDIPVVDLSAATRAVLCTVAIRATMEIEDSYGYDFDPVVRDVTKAGSGIIYQLDRESGSAYILTNYHVLYHNDATSDDRLAHTIDLYLYGQESEQYAIPATYIGGSLTYDFAVLRVEGSEVLKNSHAIPAVFADSEEVDILDPVLAVGDPEGLGMSVTTGMVCVNTEILEMTGADNRRISVRVMRIDAAINEGNSGGGLYNANGLLIGMVNAKRIGAEVDNIAYAFPSNLVRAMADNVIDHCADGEGKLLVKYDTGAEFSVSDMWLDVDPDTGRIIKRERIKVESVAVGSAFDGLLLAGDIITHISVNGEKIPVTLMHHVTDTLLTLRVGSKLGFTVDRDGRTAEIEIDVLRAMQISPDIRK